MHKLIYLITIAFAAASERNLIVKTHCENDIEKSFGVLVKTTNYSSSNNANEPYSIIGYESTDNLNKCFMIDPSDSKIDDNNGKCFKGWNLKIIETYPSKFYSLRVGTDDVACTFGNLDKCHWICYVIIIIILSICMTHCTCINRLRNCYNESCYVKYVFLTKNIEMQPSFDLVIDQREIYGNNGLLLSLKRSGDVYKLGLCEFINDTLEYHSPNHRQIEGEIEEIEKKIIRKFIANSSDYDFNHINRCWHKKESNKSYFNHVKQILHTMLYQSVYSFQTYLLSVNETTTTINWDIFTTVRESLYARANHLRRNIIRPPVAAAFNVRLEVNYFADEKTPIHSHKRVKPFEIITVDQYIPQYKCKSLKEPNKILLSLLSCMLTNYRPEIMGCKEAKEKAQMVQSHGIVIVETMQERIMNRMEFVIFSNIDTNFDFVVSDTYNLLWIDFYFGTTRDCGPCFCVAIVRFDFNVV